MSYIKHLESINKAKSDYISYLKELFNNLGATDVSHLDIYIHYSSEHGDTEVDILAISSDGIHVRVTYDYHETYDYETNSIGFIKELADSYFDEENTNEQELLNYLESLLD